ncbi:MAG TPA: lysophospholipid acyltransferase family protein [Vicinamibacteria bacterium]|nr:lysophospholipid acyltransferase family protein [Vicinamibacteria bacterium]
MTSLRALRGGLAFVAALLWMGGPCALLLYPFVLPVGAMWRAKRRGLVSWYMRFVVRGILFFFGLGGARFQWSGRLPTREPCLVVGNHQSQIDILIATMMGDPFVPAFVPRRRYTHWYIPLVAPSIWLLECPVVDPKRDAMGAVEAMRRGALENRHGILIFPEGHRTLDGEVRAFKAAGTIACLEARRVPVYLFVTDGYWKGRRLVDFLGNVPRLRGYTEVLGPFEPPAEDAALPAFVDGLRHRIVERLLERRRQQAA